MTWTVIYSKDAARVLRRMPRNAAVLVKRKIDAMAADPYSRNVNATKLKESDGYRLRVGDWRVIYELRDTELVVMVVNIGSRGNIYQ